MEDKKRKCWSCSGFRAYYSRGYCCLLREKFGFCYRHNKIVEKSDTCDKWHYRYLSKRDRKRIAINAIPEIYNKIATIEQILAEETEVAKLKDADC